MWRLAAAIGGALSSAPMQDSADQLAARIRLETGVEVAVRELERLVTSEANR